MNKSTEISPEVRERSPGNAESRPSSKKPWATLASCGSEVGTAIFQLASDI